MWPEAARVIRTDGRRGTVVASDAAPGPSRYRLALRHPSDFALDLSTGLPDVDLLPDLTAALRHLQTVHTPDSYLEAPVVPELADYKAYHLVPATASKTNAVAFHMRVRGYAREDCIAVGDSREDLGAAEVVRAFWLVANGLDRDPTIREALTANTRICEERNGAGVYEAVMTELSERRA